MEGVDGDSEAEASENSLGDALEGTGVGPSETTDGEDCDSEIEISVASLDVMLADEASRDSRGVILAGGGVGPSEATEGVVADTRSLLGA